MVVKKPNLFIIGHPRCGTTSLYLMLKQHPEIFMPKEKEPHYFCGDVKQKIKSEKEYLLLFSKAKKHKIIGEATPNYLRSKIAAKEIKKFSPDAKIIIILREPIDFIRALYQMDAASGNEKLSEINKGIFQKKYLQKTEYYKQVKRYLDNFSKKNIKIIIYCDYKNNNNKTLRGIFRFLGVDENFVPERESINPSRFNGWGKLNIFLKSPVSTKIRKAIRNSFPKSIIKPLQKTYRKAIYKNGRMKIPEKTKTELKKRIKPRVKKANELLHKEGFLDKTRNLVKEWDYKEIN